MVKTTVITKPQNGKAVSKTTKGQKADALKDKTGKKVVSTQAKMVKKSVSAAVEPVAKKKAGAPNVSSKKAQPKAQTKANIKAKTAAAASSAQPIKTNSGVTAATAAPSIEAKGIIFWEVLRVWLNGWCKAFDLKGRSSRFDLWGFLLVNTVLMTCLQIICTYVLSPAYLRYANGHGYSFERIDYMVRIAELLFFVTVFVPFIPLGALIIRRLHDLGKLAWHNYFEPVFMGGVVLWVLFSTLTDLDMEMYPYTWLLLCTCFITIIYSVGYYGLKLLIISMFYRGEIRDNEYGKSLGNDDVSERYALKFSCFYFLLLATVILFYLVLVML